MNEILREYKEKFKLLKEVFALESELLARKRIFTRHGVKYEYPPPHPHEEFLLYQDINFLRERLKVVKEHINYTGQLLEKYKYTIDYTQEMKKEDEWKEEFWNKVFNKHIED